LTSKPIKALLISLLETCELTTMLSKYSSELIFSLMVVLGELIPEYNSFRCGSICGVSMLCRTWSADHGTKGSCVLSNCGMNYSVLFFSISLFPMMGLTAVSELCIKS
jgi:hypothetical protein